MSKRDREREDLQREFDTLSALQKSGALPLLDTGGFEPFALTTALVKFFSPVEPRVSVPSKIDGDRIN